MSEMTMTDNADIQSLGRHALIGALAIVGLLGGMTVWAATAEIAGAVVTSGVIVVESYTKRVQHQEGGTVRQILVRNGDRVSAGQPLVRLDNTVAAANLAVIDAQLNEALVQEARLVAEIDGKSQVVSPQGLDGTLIAASLRTQQRILAAHIEARDGRVGQLEEQVVQLEREIEGLDLQLKASETQLALLNQEMGDLAGLLDKKLVESSRVTALKKQLASEEGNRGRLVASIAEAKASIAERHLQMAQIQNDYLSTALNDLQKARELIAELSQQRLAANDKLSRAEVTAPQAGIVHESTVHTVGGVLAPGEVLMQIVPQDDRLLVGIKIDPQDVDKIELGQSVVLRLSAFDQRSTPEINGEVEAISPDYIVEQATGRQYYTGRIVIAEGELQRLPDHIKLRPGMPVQAFVTTANRSVLSYLLHPLLEEMSLALRED